MWGTRCGKKQSTAEVVAQIVLRTRQRGEQERGNISAALSYLRRLRWAGQGPCDPSALRRRIPAGGPQGGPANAAPRSPCCCRLRSQLGPELMERHGEALEMLEQMRNELMPEVKASGSLVKCVAALLLGAGSLSPTQLPSHVRQGPAVQPYPVAARWPACPAGASGDCAG